jgi:hypothetical protein
MHDIKAAIEAATFTQLDDIAKSVWGGYGTLFDDDTAQSLGDAIEARRRALAPSTREMPHKPATARQGSPRRPCRSPDRSRSIARRRQLAASGAVPATIAANFTTAELAVLSIIAREIQRSTPLVRERSSAGFSWCMDRIAAVAGVSRTTARNAIRQAQALGLITVEERRRNRWRSDTNVITIISREWTSWLRLGGGRKKPTTTNNTKISLGVSHSRSQSVLDTESRQRLYSGDGEADRRPQADLSR